MRFKQIALDCAEGLGLNAVARGATGRRVRILAYHGVEALDDAILNWDGLQVAPGTFEEHLRILRRDYDVRPLAEAVEYLAGRGSGGKAMACITFDDGYRNNLTVAGPLLNRYGMPATFFVTTGFVDGSSRAWWYDLRAAVRDTRAPDCPLPGGERVRLADDAARVRFLAGWEAHLKAMSAAERFGRMRALAAELGAAAIAPHPEFLAADEVRQLVSLGFEVAPHTDAHVSFGWEPEDALKRDIETSLRKIRDMTGQAALHYSFPYGVPAGERDWVREFLLERGLRAAVTTEEGLNAPGADVFRLKRLNVSGDHTPPAMKALVSGLAPALRSRGRRKTGR